MTTSTPSRKLAISPIYEGITVRDSSLSASIQAIVAAECGHLELALAYLGETAFIDLRDLASNTHDGVHLAALAGAWQAVVAGLGGMRDYGETLSFAPWLPRTGDAAAALGCCIEGAGSASRFARAKRPTSCSTESRSN